MGFAGNDVIEGGAGADGIFGSGGFDYASYRGSTAGVYASLTDLLGHYGDAKGDQLYGIEGLIGSAYRDLLVGGDQGDILHGEGGASSSAASTATTSFTVATATICSKAGSVTTGWMAAAVPTRPASTTMAAGWWPTSPRARPAALPPATIP